MSQINELISQEVAKLIQGLFSDKQIVTVTGADVSNDLRWADIWISVYQGNEKAVLNTLEQKKYDLQETLNRKIELKYVPKIKFKIDKTGRQVDKIQSILTKIKKN